MKCQMQGQMTIFDFIPKTMKTYNDCPGCSARRYSFECMEKRGFLWDRYRGDYYFINGELARLPLDQRECKKEGNGLR